MIVSEKAADEISFPALMDFSLCFPLGTSEIGTVNINEGLSFENVRSEGLAMHPYEFDSLSTPVIDTGSSRDPDCWVSLRCFTRDQQPRQGLRTRSICPILWLTYVDVGTPRSTRRGQVSVRMQCAY